jgi:hypothetical protein
VRIVRKLMIIMAAALLLCGAFAMAAQATPLTLQDLIDLGSTGIQIDDKVFYDFTYGGTASGGAAVIPASGIGVTPLTTPYNPGLQFQAAWAVSAGQTLDSAISYYVKVLPGGYAIKDVSASMAGYGFTDGGVVGVGETVALDTTTIANVVLHSDSTGTVDYASATFSPTYGPLFVTKDIGLAGHTDGFATVSVVTNRFSEVPVPPTALLLGSGLLGLVGFRFRKNRA